MNKEKNIGYNFVMNSILTMSSFVFPLITFPYVSRVLLAEGVGKVSFATSIISYFGMVAQLGIPVYGVRACAQVRDNKEELTKTVQEILIINISMMIISYLALFIMLFNVPRFSGDKTLYMIVSLNILFNTIGIEWLYKALEQYSYITLRSISFKFIAVIAMLLLVKNSSDYYIYAAISIFAASASGILNIIRVRKYITFQRFSSYNIKKHMKSIIVFFAMSCATTIYTNLDSIMIGFMCSDADVGYYATSIKIKNILASIVSSLGTVLLPRVSYYIKSNRKKEFYSITKKAIRFVFIISCPMVIYFLIFSKECIEVLAGSGFSKSIVSMKIIMPTLLFIGLTNIMGIQILVPFGKEKKVLQSEIIGAIINLIFNSILIPIYGIAGAAVGTLFAEMAVFVFQVFILRDVVKDAFKSVSYIKIAFAIGIASLFVYRIKIMGLGTFTSLMISAIIYWGTYGIMLLISKEKLIVELVFPYFKKFKRR